MNVVDRIFKDYKGTVEQLKNWMKDYLRLGIYDRIALRNRMARNSVVVDWSVRVQDYFNVYEQLL